MLVVKTRGLQENWRESGMEYVQELESLKKEISKSGKKVDNITGLIEKFSDLEDLRETVKDFQNNNVLSRIESKIDIIAQSDSSDTVNFLIDELSGEISQKFEQLSSKIASLEELNSQITEVMSSGNAEPAQIKTLSKQEFGEIGEKIDDISSNYRLILENLNEAQKQMADFKEGTNQQLSIQDFANEIKSSVSAINNQSLLTLGDKINNLLELFQNIDSDFIKNISSLNETVSSIDKNFSLVREKLDFLSENYNNINLEKSSNLEEGLNELKKAVSMQLAENKTSFEENLSSIQEDFKIVSQAFETRGSDEETLEKINFVASLIMDLKDGIYIQNENNENLVEQTENKSESRVLWENMERINNLFDQINIRLGDESFENEIKQQFLKVEDNFERLEDIVADMSSFQDLNLQINRLGENIDKIKEKVDDNSDSGQILDNLSSLNNDINALKENLPEKTIYSELKESFISLSSRVFEVYENLYPLQNLQTVNEGFESAQEKLNIIIEKLNNNEIETQEQAQGLSKGINNIHSLLDTDVIENLETLKDQLSETAGKLYKLNDDVKNGNESSAEIIGDIKYLNLKSDELKDTLDRIIKINNNNREITENSFEDIKNALSYLNNEVREIKESTGQKLTSESFNNFINAFYEKLDLLKEQNNSKAETNDIKNLIEAVRSEVDNVKNSGLSADNFNNAAGTIYSCLEQLQEQVSDKTDSEQNRELLGLIKEEIDVLNLKIEKNKISEELKENIYNPQYLDSINENFQSTQDKLNNLLESVNNYNPEFIINDMGLDERFNNIHFHIDSKVLNSLSEIKESLNNLNVSQNAVEDNQDTLQHLYSHLEEISNNLKYNTENKISEELLNNLLQEVSNIKELTDNETAIYRIDEVINRINGLDEKISGLQELSEFKENFETIKENICQLEEKFNYTNERISEFVKFTENDLNRENTEVSEQLQNITEELNYKIEYNAQNLNKFLCEFSSAVENLQSFEDKDSIKENLFVLSNSLDNVSNNVSSLCEEIHSLKIIQEKVENISNQMEFVSSNEEINEINNKIDNLTEEIRLYRESLAQTNQTGPKQDIGEIFLKIDEIKESTANSSKAGLEKLDNIEENFSGEFGSINENIIEVKNKIENLNNSLSGLNSENREIFENALESGLDEIKGLSSLVSQDVSVLKTVMTDLFDAIGSMDESYGEKISKKDLENVFNRLENSINTSKPDIEELKASSGRLSENLEGLLNNFSEMSGETREKLDRFFELSRELESKINNNYHNTDEILNSLKRLSELSENQFSATNQTLDIIKNEFSTLGEELNGFDRDLTDINSKINKIIINADENTGLLSNNIKGSLNDLREDIRNNLENNAQTLKQTNKTHINELSNNLSQIYKKIEGLSNISQKGFSSSDNLREAIIQMAEWIDSAGKLLEDNNENIVKSLENIEAVCKKFEGFEVRLENIEAKIEKIGEKRAEDELRQMILEVRDRMPLPNGKKNENPIILDKIDRLETQMVLFETKIQKILDFVEK